MNHNHNHNHNMNMDNYGKTLRIVNVRTNIYIGDSQNGAVRAITDSLGGRIKGWDSSYERAFLFTQPEAFRFIRDNPGYAIVGLNPGIR